jgi:hypothetical protein
MNAPFSLVALLILTHHVELHERLERVNAAIISSTIVVVAKVLISEDVHISNLVLSLVLGEAVASRKKS